MWFSKKTGTWQTTMIADRPVRTYEPTTPRHPFGLLYLHDQDGKPLDEVPIANQLVEQWGCRVICPLAGPTWWLDASESWVQGPVLDWVQANWNTPRFALLGLGMGGQGALRWGLADGARRLLPSPQPGEGLGVRGNYPVVISLQAAIAFEQLHGQGTILDQLFPSPEHCRQQTAGMLINPRSCPPHLALIAHRNDSLWFRGNDRLHEKLLALGVEHHADLTGDGSEAWWREQWQFALQFIELGMRKVANRLM